MIQRVLNQPVIPVQPRNQSANIFPDGTKRSNFAELLQQKLSTGNLNFSAHAVNRLSQRNIHLSELDLGRLEQAVNTIQSKGGRDSLITMDNVAYVVNIPNKTVITALDQFQASSNVFTNIDSVLFVNSQI